MAVGESCYATTDSSGEPICGVHKEPLRRQNLKSQMPGLAPTQWLVCPISGQHVQYKP
jgi:hypothetical protein